MQHDFYRPASVVRIRAETGQLAPCDLGGFSLRQSADAPVTVGGIQLRRARISVLT